jgi:hypothetical protein
MTKPKLTKRTLISSLSGEHQCIVAERLRQMLRATVLHHSIDVHSVLLHAWKGFKENAEGDMRSTRICTVNPQVSDDATYLDLELN